MERTYFNQVITSESATGRAEINRTYDNFFIKDAKKVDMGVDKFQMLLTSIPLMIFDRSTNYYTFELTWGAFTSGRISLNTYFYSIFPAGNQFANYIYHQSHFIDIMNMALAGAFTVVSVSAGFPANQQAPFFYADPNTHILQLYVTNGYLEGAGANRINILCNMSIAYEFLDGFPKYGVNPSTLNPSPTGQDARLFCYNKIVNAVTIGSGGGAVIYYIQATDSKEDTLIKWNVCKGIVITTNLKVRREAFPKGEGIQRNASLQTTDILMNFDILYNNNTKPILLNYVSNSYDKIINLTNQEDTSTIGLKFFWYDKNNTMYELLVYRDDICSIRLFFNNFKPQLK